MLDSPEFKILDHAPAQRDENVNLGCAYAPGAKLHLVQKPMPQPDKGEVLLHVKATCVHSSLTAPWLRH